MRSLLLSIALLAAACSSESLVACGTDSSICAPYGALCLGGFCHRPDEPGLDLGGLDFSTARNQTAACSADSPCTAQTSPICDPGAHACRACTADECVGHASGGLCASSGPLAGACVQCLDASQCSATHNICDAATGTCAPCTASAQCGSGICDAGQCVAATDITYVDNKQTPCAGADGSHDKAYCTIADALVAMGSTRKYMFIAGSATSYVGLQLTSSAPDDLVVVGPGRGATPTARLTTYNPSSFYRYSVGAGTTSSVKHVVLDGLDLYGVPGGGLMDAVIYWGGDNQLTVRDTLIHGGNGYALQRTGCDVTLVNTEITALGGPVIFFDTGSAPGAFTMQRSTLHDNRGGIYVRAAQATLENNFIVNGDAMGTGSTEAVNLNVTGSLVFRANTIAGNKLAVGEFAVLCTGANRTLADSIIIGNTLNGGTQFSGCTLSNVVTGPDGAGGASQLLPAFVSATDYRLKTGDPANSACCVDKASSGPVVDIDGNARPRGAGWDIGAHEVQ